MRVLGMAAVLVASLTASLWADTHEVVRTTFAGHETVSALYLQDKNSRTEHLSGDGRQVVTIRDAERKLGYILDLPSQKYVELVPQGPDLILSLARWIARPPRIRESGKTVNIYYQMVDTGERKQFFGFTARHLFLHERHVAEPGACDSTYQTEKNGWYLPPTESSTAHPSFRLVAAYQLAGVPAQCHDTIVNHGDPSPPGMAVLETNGSSTREVLELSHEPLDKTLFEVPAHFQKVEALPGYPSMTWSQRLQMEWAQLERAFESWFE